MSRAPIALLVVAVASAMTMITLNAAADPSVRAAASCRANGGLPDRTCTPGARDRHVTQSNIAKTICRTGYSTTVRPPTSYTTPLKQQQMRAYGYYAGRSTRSYEEDHLISLELGGSPRSPKNLWPEAYKPKPGAYQKDVVEDDLHERVCSGSMTLRKAQHAEAADWLAVYRRIRP